MVLFLPSDKQNLQIMKAKEQFLQNILARIKVLQDAYAYNKDLPDDVFESLLNGNGHSKGFQPIESAINGNGKKEYGDKKNLVRDIIASEKNGLKRADIIMKYVQLRPGEKAVNIVTNAITGLSNDGEIEAYKPRNKRGKGAFWRVKASQE
jgi:hypothetical protein